MEKLTGERMEWETRRDVDNKAIAFSCPTLKIVSTLILCTALHLGCRPEIDIKEARECAHVFHNNFQAQNYEAIYANASQRFKNVRGREAYISMMKEIQNEYGKLLNIKEERAGSIVSTDAGKAWDFIFSLKFEKAKATEHLIFTRDASGQMQLWLFELS